MAVRGVVLSRPSQRTCVGCRAVDARAALVRVAGAPGHGAWVHQRAACIEAGLRGGLQRSLRRPPTAAERSRLSSIGDISQIADVPSQKAAGLAGAKAVETPPRIQAKE